MANENMVRRVGQLATDVAGSHVAYQKALQAEIDARAGVLVEIVNLVRPALPAICSRVIAGGRISASEQSRDAASWKGIKIGGTGLQPRVVVGKRGPFSGHDLYIAEEDGAFVELRFHGRWSGVAGESSDWASVAQKVSAVDVARDHQTDVIIARVIRALEAQIHGDKADRTRWLLALASRLDAVASMLKAPL